MLYLGHSALLIGETVDSVLGFCPVKFIHWTSIGDYCLKHCLKSTMRSSRSFSFGFAIFPLYWLSHSLKTLLSASYKFLCSVWAEFCVSDMLLLKLDIAFIYIQTRALGISHHNLREKPPSSTHPPYDCYPQDEKPTNSVLCRFCMVRTSTFTWGLVLVMFHVVIL